MRTRTRPARRRFGLAVLRARAVRARPRKNACFIAITGSSAKSTTTALLAHVLRRQGKVRTQLFRNSLLNVAKAVLATRSDDAYAVLELGVARRGDMGPLSDVTRPDVAIVTLVGIEHYSSFRSREAVALEKGRLVEATRPDGFVLLNADDAQVMGMAERSPARVVTFGREKDADYRVTHVEQHFPGMLTVDVAWRGGTRRLKAKFVGEHFWLSVVAAFAVATERGMSAEAIEEAIADFEPLHGRCAVMTSEGGPVFIVDTAKAPWETIELPMRTVGSMDAPRKRIVFGQMSDYAGNPNSKYRAAYAAARAVADQVIFVGDNAHKHRASEDDVSQGRIIEAVNAREVYEHLRATAVDGEVVLLKSSQNLHLERVALAFQTEVRCWAERCGIEQGCIRCGLYAHPYEEHRAILKKRERARRFRRLVPFMADHDTDD